VSHVFMYIKRLRALCFHMLHNGFVRWMRPHNTSLLRGTVAGLAKGRTQLLVENALLRQQLIVLSRQIKRPACRKKDRFLLVFLARMARTWKQALFIVQPETLLTLASRALPLVLEAQVKGEFETARAILRDNRIDQGHGDEKSASSLPNASVASYSSWIFVCVNEPSKSI